MNRYYLISTPVVEVNLHLVFIDYFRNSCCHNILFSIDLWNEFKLKSEGAIAATKTELRALELGYIPSNPIVDSRYDLIIDNRTRLLRVQIKYADGIPSSSSGAIVVKLAYENRQKKVYTYSACEVDALIVYLPQIDKLCFFLPEIFEGKRNLNIRIKSAKNNQKTGVIYAKDYYW